MSTEADGRLLLSLADAEAAGHELGEQPSWSSPDVGNTTINGGTVPITSGGSPDGEDEHDLATRCFVGTPVTGDAVLPTTATGPSLARPGGPEGGDPRRALLGPVAGR